MWIARNCAKNDISYIVTMNKPIVKVDTSTGGVTFEDNTKGCSYVKYYRHADFEKSHPALVLEPGEGPYPLNIGLSREPKLFGGTNHPNVKAAAKAIVDSMSPDAPAPDVGDAITDGVESE